jgi:RNA polymerase sigma-70 factor (ECF subfamily)
VVEARLALVRALDPGLAEALRDHPDLEPALVDAIGRMRAATRREPGPDVWFLVARGLAPGDLPPALGERHWEDLAILDAFRSDDAHAVTLVNGPIRERTLAAVVSAGADLDTANDLFQSRIARLLGPLERIGYTGRGRLTTWLKRCVVNDFLNHSRRESRLDADDALTRVLVSANPEPSLVAQLQAPVFREALRIAFDALPGDDRQLLRLVHIDGLSAQQAGAILGLHRVSIQRRLGVARDNLRTRTKTVLHERFGLAAGEVTTLIRSLLEGFHVTVSALLADKPA